MNDNAQHSSPIYFDPNRVKVDITQMLFQYNIWSNSHQKNVLLLYLNIYRLLVCANLAKNAGIAKKEENSSICCSVQHMCMHNSTTLLSNGISTFLAIVI